MKNLTIDPERLWGDLMETARSARTAKGGICRLTLTDLDRQVRDWFQGAQRKRSAARSPSTTWATCSRGARARARRAADCVGQPSRHAADRRQIRRRARRARGARGDAHAACAPATRPSRRSKWSTGRTRKARALRRRCWRPASLPACSRASCGRRAQTATARRFGAALDAIGYRGPKPAAQHQLSAFFELHIEQGPYPRSRRQGHRGRHRRAGDALV